MTFTEFIQMLHLDKGISFVLSILVVYLLFIIVKNIPKWIPTFLEVSKKFITVLDESNEIQKSVIDVISNTEKMHQIMDEKMDIQHEEVDNRISEVLEQIVTLQDIVKSQGRADEDFRKVLAKEIEKLKDEVKILDLYRKEGDK